jgi:hypothetical protein
MKNQSLHLVFMLCLLASLCNAQLPYYLPTNGLVAWYPFNGNANDESGNGHDGITSNAQLTLDRFGNESSAFEFNGFSSHIRVPHNTSLNALPITISAWYKEDGQTGRSQFLVSKYPCQSFNGYSMHLNEGHPSAYYYSINDSGSIINLDGESPNYQIPTSGVWHCITLSISDSIFTYYLDGTVILQSTFSGDLGYVTTTLSDLYFGKYAGPCLDYVPEERYHTLGQLDDIAIYNRALTQSEVTALYTATATNTGGGTTSTTTAPPGIPYQAEVRNESGEVLANANVNVRFTLHELTANGTVSYQETHALTTNELGLFAATIGAGTAVQGTFASINWAQTTKFLQVEVDTGNGFITMGNQQLMSVPYALYAANSQQGPQGPAGADGQQGPAGIDGTDGVNGKNSMILTSNEPAGVNCAVGGVKVQSGIDANSNNILEESEITHNSTQYICNGTSFSNQGQGCSGVQIFEYTGQPQLFSIPACTNELMIECWGAQGQFGGGKGGYCMGRFYPSNATQLYVYVGGQNGYNGGGIGFNPINFSNQNGGGASDVRTNDNLSSRLIVAGGGGSGYQILFYNNNSIIPLLGGDGGSCSNGSQILYEGEAGTSAANIMQNNNCGTSATTGNFGSLQNNWARASGGGFSGGISACNTNPCSTTDGQLGQGGNGQAGGGGGYYGGGGASSSGTTATIAASAGGGSSWTGGCEPPYYFMGGSREGNGKVRITWH